MRSILDNISWNVPDFVKGVAILAIGYLVFIYLKALVLRIRMFVDRQIDKGSASDTTKTSTLGISKFFIKALVYFLILILVLENLGVNVTSLIAGLGIGGIAVALAVQSILGDLFASLTILLDKPFVVGDVIVVGEYTGAVENVGIKTTRIRSIWGEQLIFSNTDLLKSRIRNFGRMSERMVVLNLKIDKTTSIAKLRKVCVHVRTVVENVAMTHFERAHFKDISDFAFQFEVVFKVMSPDVTSYMDVQERINFGILEILERNEIMIAYPTQKLFLEQAIV